MSDSRETIMYRGRERQVVGRLHYPGPPEPGSLIGPNGWGETLVVLTTRVENGREVTLIGRAITSDAEHAAPRPRLETPRDSSAP